MIQHKTGKITLMTCLLVMMTAACITTAYADDSPLATESIDPAGNMLVYVSASNCVVYIEPTDEKMLGVAYDESALSMQHDPSRGQDLLIFDSASGQRMGHDAAATVYVPQNTYRHLEVNTEQADAVVSGGIDCGQTLYATDHSSVEVQYAPNKDNQYTLGVLDNSTMDFIVDESATNYSIRVNINDNSSLNVPQDWIPNHNPRIIMGLFEYSNGNGNMNIEASLRNNSTLNILHAQ